MIGWRNAGYRKLRTIDFSIIPDRTDVIEIGLKPAGDWAAAVWGMGWMTSVFHCRGTTEVEIDKLNSVEIGWQKTGAPRWRNQAGNWSMPVDVWCRLSSVLNILHSVMYWQSSCCWLAVCWFNESAVIPSTNGAFCLRLGMLNEVQIFELRKKYLNSNSFLTLRSSTFKYRLV